MTASESFSAYWWYHAPNLVLAALIYTVIGRYILELVFSKKQDAVMLGVFRTLTDPVVRIVRTITPQIVPPGLVVVFTVFWIMALRLFWFLTAVAYGMRLT
ncbi:MAG: hypothetical protein H6876_00560 [Hyphomicrobiaceae bacterium]|nr:hypothetical protein [Hyphomicrobiaceae bacterium]